VNETIADEDSPQKTQKDKKHKEKSFCVFCPFVTFVVNSIPHPQSPIKGG
jgi:hypothetical protein